MKRCVRHNEEKNYDYACLTNTTHTPTWTTWRSQEQAATTWQDYDGLIEHEEEEVETP